MLKGEHKGVVAENIREMKQSGMSERQAVLASMKRTKTEAKNQVLSSPSGPSEDYPYGLCLSLEDETLEKLGMDELPKVGKPVKIVAEGKVESVSQNSSERGQNHRSARVQITKMKLG